MHARVRFAPSPTGHLHLGGLRTALFNQLLARCTGGTFLLRVEDTDDARRVEGSVEGIVSVLEWCGIASDEAVRVQSEHLTSYTDAAQGLVQRGELPAAQSWTHFGFVPSTIQPLLYESIDLVAQNMSSTQFCEIVQHSVIVL